MRRPEPDSGAGDFGERKLRLMCGRIDERHAARRPTESASPDVSKMPVDAHGKKQVPGIPSAVELGAQIVERLHAVEGELAFRAELRDHGERHPGVIAGIAYGSIAE